MQAFIYPCDAHAVSSLGPLLKAKGWEVHGLAAADTYPEWVVPTSQMSGVNEEFCRLISNVDLAIVYLPGNETRIKQFISIWNEHPCSKQQVLIGIAGPLSWAGTVAGHPMADEAPTPITEASLPRRHSAYVARRSAEMEHALLRSARKSSRKAYVVCSGLLYGAGEDDGGLAALFRTAWKGREPVPVYGDGQNLLPLVHVRQLAAYVAALYEAQPPQQYYLLAEAATVKLADLAAGIANTLGSGATRLVGRAEVLLQEGIGHLLLDLPMQTTPLQGFAPAAFPPFLESLEATALEYLQSRHLTPLRFLLMGPPMAGKSVLARQLGREYGLEVLDASALLAAVNDMDADAQKVMKAELQSKEPRLSDRSMARLLSHCIARLEGARRGWVLDAWPKTLAQARAVFGGEFDDQGKPAEKGKAAAAPVGPPPGFQRVSAPTHLLQVAAPEEQLRARMTAIAQAELRNAQAAAAAAAAAAPAAGVAPAKGVKAKDAVVVLPGHNNPKDFQRRLDVYQQHRHADGVALQAKVAQVQQQWEQEQQAKRAAALQALQQETARERARRLEQLAGSGTPRQAAEGKEEEEQATGPQLPQHGGFVGYLEAAGAELVLLDNPDEEGTRRASTEDSSCPQPTPATTALQAAKAVIGTPHNFDGFPAPSDREGGANTGPQQPDAGEQDQDFSIPAAVLAAYEAHEQEVAGAWEQRQERAARVEVEPFKQNLMRHVMPAVATALVDMRRAHPMDPVEVLADYLQGCAPMFEDPYSDPYEAPIYAERLAKHEAKAARVAAAAAAAAANSGAHQLQAIAS